MEFQRYLDPFAYALNRQGVELKQEGERITNATNLVKMGIAQKELDLMNENFAATRDGADSQGGIIGLGEAGAGRGASSAQGGMEVAGGSTLGTKQLVDMSNKFAATADRMRFFRNGRVAASYAARAESALKDAVLEQEREYTRRVKFFDALKDAAAVASQSPEAMGRALALLSHQLPPGMDINKVLYNPVGKGGLGLQMGPNNMPVWQKEQWDQIGQFSTVGKEQHHMKHLETMENLKTQQVRLAEEEATRRVQADAIREASLRDRERAREEDDQFGRLKPGWKWINNKNKSLGQEPIPLQGDPKVLEEANKSLEKDPLWKNYSLYQQAKGAIVGLEQKLATGGYNAISAADIQQLRSHYANIIQDFRTRAGGVKDLKEFDKMNGVLQSLDKWLSTIGRGTPAASERVAKEAIGVVKDEYLTRTSNLAVEELRMARNVFTRKGNPDALRLKADIPYLVANGKAQVKPNDEGEMWIAIMMPDGTKKTFPYPQGAYQ